MGDHNDQKRCCACHCLRYSKLKLFRQRVGLGFRPDMPQIIMHGEWTMQWAMSMKDQFFYIKFVSIYWCHTESTICIVKSILTVDIWVLSFTFKSTIISTIGALYLPSIQPVIAPSVDGLSKPIETIYGLVWSSNCPMHCVENLHNHASPASPWLKIS